MLQVNLGIITMYGIKMYDCIQSRC